MDYWKQETTPWVSYSVLAGGLLSALILRWIVQVEADLHSVITSF
ncbi:MAG: hypothetical protein UT62_C0029G0007 [Parcubacteria group bacterium GW2011_GWC1_39_8]|nr:MAG: hypothetical protein UT62_C0029G0007 [Parcubacteria group bacterium GW2011_GWC1_39_8]